MRGARLNVGEPVYRTDEPAISVYERGGTLEGAVGRVDSIESNPEGETVYWVQWGDAGVCVDYLRGEGIQRKWLKFEIGQLIRVVGVHRLKGEVKDICGDGGAVSILFQGHDWAALYLSTEVEPVTPCDCVWCAEV